MPECADLRPNRLSMEVMATFISPLTQSPWAWRYIMSFLYLPLYVFFVSVFNQLYFGSIRIEFLNLFLLYISMFDPIYKFGI